MAERICNEDGGWFCSSCGYFRDDYFDSVSLASCPVCGENLIDSILTVDRHFRLFSRGVFCDDKECPQWLLNLRMRPTQMSVAKGGW